MWLKLTDLQTFFRYLHVFQVVEYITTVIERLHLKKEIFQKKIDKSPIFANCMKSRFEKVSSGTYFQFDVFWIYMLWGIQNQYLFCARTCGLTSPSHHAEWRVDPKAMKVKMVFGFGYPRACRFRKTKPINQFRSLPLPSLKIGPFLPILATFYEFKSRFEKNR
jgi:hypothetical protein